ncbi:hypothetical protein BJY01DRAFT_239315 [Aspergillus pseudoustus]|uniref:NAD(P)-binding domain-containing protein n=1 Tax=Aspergillus pseudoustus TaxID=1810923 RepID=A0ABR4J4Q2_9EURO
MVNFDDDRSAFFPASGGLGASIANHRLKFVPASQLTFISRRPEKQVEASRAGVTVRGADYDEPESLENAFDGIDMLMLVSYPSIDIENVSHIFYSSLALAGDLGTTSAAHTAPGTTAFIYTAIREGLYSESFPRDELGEATTKMVVDYVCRGDREGFAYLNKAVLLSGPREVSLRETVDVLQRVVSKSVTIKQISVDEYVALPQMQGRGEAAVVTPVLAELLGRAPEDFETTVRDLAQSQQMDRLQSAWS